MSGTLAANATNITATNESITIQGTTTIADGITLVVDSGTADKDITFAAITAGDAEGQNLTIDAGTNANAQIFLNGDVTNLDTLSITDAGILNLVGNITVDTLVIPTAVNNVIVSGNITTTADTSFANVGTTIIGNADDDVNTFGGGLDITAGPTSATAITLQGTIKTTNDQIDIGDADTGIRIAGTATITTNGAGVINLAGAISGAGGAQNLIINSTGATTISQAVTALQNLTTDALGSTILEGNVTTSALQTYGDTVTISGTRTLQGTTVSMASVQGNGDDDDELTITGIFDLNGAATADLKTLSVSSSSNIGGDVTTSTTQTYTGAVVMSGGDRTLTATQVNFGNTVDGGGAELAIVGILNLDGALTNTTNLSVTGATALGADVTTSGTQEYTSLVTADVAAKRTLTGSTITLTGGLDGGAQALDIAGDLVTGAAMTNITVLDVSGTASLGGSVTTADSLTIDGTLTLTTNITLDSTGNNATDDITLAAISGTAAGATESLVLDAGAAGAISVSGAVTGLEDLSLTLSDGATFAAVTLNNDFTITGATTGANITFNGNLSLGGDFITAASNYNIAINENITVADQVTFTNTGLLVLGNGTDDDLTFGGGITAIAQATGGYDADAIKIAGNIITTQDVVQLGSALVGITLTADSTITTGAGAGNIDLDGIIIGGDNSLGLNAGSGLITSALEISGISTLTITQSGGTIFTGNVGATTVTLTDSTGAIEFDGDLAATTLNVAAGAVEGGFDVEINEDATHY